MNARACVVPWACVRGTVGVRGRVCARARAHVYVWVYVCIPHAFVCERGKVGENRGQLDCMFLCCCRMHGNSNLAPVLATASCEKRG